MNQRNESPLTFHSFGWQLIENKYFCRFLLEKGNIIVGDRAINGLAGSLQYSLAKLLSHPQNYRMWTFSAISSPSELFNILYQALYVDDERSDDEVKNDKMRYARFDVSFLHPSLDRWHVFLVDFQDHSWLLWRELHQVPSGEFVPGSIESTVLEAGEFEAAAVLCNQSMDNIVNQKN